MSRARGRGAVPFSTVGSAASAAVHERLDLILKSAVVFMSPEVLGT